MEDGVQRNLLKIFATSSKFGDHVDSGGMNKQIFFKFYFAVF